MKKTYAIVIIVVVLLSTVTIALAGFRAINQQQDSASGPTKTTQKPGPSSTPMPKPSSAGSPTDFPTKTQPPQPSPSPTATPSPMPTATYSVVSVKDVSYGSDPAQKFDAYVPQNSPLPRPLIIFVHGGAWIAGDKADVSAIANFLASRGFMVINMNYRLLPDFSYPAPMEDIQQLLKWVSQNAEKYKIDMAHIGMSGHSAGGHLVSLYALTQDKNYIAGGSALPKVYAIAPMAGGYTLEGINITSQRREDTIMAWLETANPQSLGLPIDQIDGGNNVSFLVLYGGKDVNSPPSQSTLFYQALVNAGVPAQIKLYPDRDHLTLVSGIPNNDEVAQDLVAFFNENLK